MESKGITRFPQTKSMVTFHWIARTCSSLRPHRSTPQALIPVVSSTLDKFFIVRIAWVFGLNGKNFIKTMINVGKTYDTVRVVNDQIGTPTYTYDLARLLVDMIETDKYGYYHATNSESVPGEFTSWADLAEEAYRAAGMHVKVLRVTTAEHGLSKAARPFNSRLDKSKLVENGFKSLPDWKDAVERYIKEVGLRHGADQSNV